MNKISIAEVLRLRAVSPLFSDRLQGASLRMTALLKGSRKSGRECQVAKKSKKSQPLRMTILQEYRRNELALTYMGLGGWLPRVASTTTLATISLPSLRPSRPQ